MKVLLLLLLESLQVRVGFGISGKRASSVRMTLGVDGRRVGGGVSAQEHVSGALKLGDDAELERSITRTDWRGYRLGLPPHLIVRREDIQHRKFIYMESENALAFGVAIGFGLVMMFLLMAITVYGMMSNGGASKLSEEIAKLEHSMQEHVMTIAHHPRGLAHLPTATLEDWRERIDAERVEDRDEVEQEHKDGEKHEHKRRHEHGDDEREHHGPHGHHVDHPKDPPESGAAVSSGVEGPP